MIYSGTLQGFPDSYAAGAQDPKANSPESWTTGEGHTYRFALTVADTNAAQGLTYTQSFTWEGRNQAAGELTEVFGTGGCVSDDGSGGACVDTGSPGWYFRDVVVTADGAYAYAAIELNGALLSFSRNTTTGALTQLPGTTGCISEDGSGGACVDGKALTGIDQLALSPDGAHLYATAGGASDAVLSFSRNSGTGQLTQLAGTAGCISETGTGGLCVDGKGLDDAVHVVVSPDGAHVYAVSQASSAVTIFSRNSGTGALTQLAGTAGCVSDSGSGGACVDGTALDGTYGTVVSPDGRTVHAVTINSDAVVTFARDSSTGRLTQLAGTAGCISDTGSGGACTDGTALDGPVDLDISADGASIYAVTTNSASVVNLARAP